jgi:hypothetical protein
MNFSEMIQEMTRRMKANDKAEKADYANRMEEVMTMYKWFIKEVMAVAKEDGSSNPQWVLEYWAHNQWLCIKQGRWDLVLEPAKRALTRMAIKAS